MFLGPRLKPPSLALIVEEILEWVGPVAAVVSVSFGRGRLVWFTRMSVGKDSHKHNNISIQLVHRRQASTLLMMHEKRKNLSLSQGLNLGLLNTSQMLLPLSHQDS